MTTVDNNAVDFIDNFDDWQVTREDRCQRRVLPRQSVEQRAEIAPGRAVPIAKDSFGFMLLDPGPGDHDLLLRFETPLENRVGAIAGALTLALMIWLIWHFRRSAQP